MPFFTVIIPAYDRYFQLKSAIDSVLSQSYKDFELVVVDDGSTDKTTLIESEYSDSIIYLRQNNKGVSSARNTGIKISNSPYIAFLDSDDLWLPGKLQGQYLYIKENPGIRIHQTEEIWIRNGKRVNPMKKHAKVEGDIFFNSLELCMISPSSVVIERGIFEKYGMFDEKLPVCEDYDLWLRVTPYEKVGLIRKNLIKKFGGHSSQLSRSFWGIDRFRIYSLVKLLIAETGKIKSIYSIKARETAARKSKILFDGAVKRGNIKFANRINKIIGYLESGNYSSIDLMTLLEK